MKTKKRIVMIGILLMLSLSLVACSSSGSKTFTTAELAKYNGLNGAKAYVAVNGKVYDVTTAKGWVNGSHQGVQAGQDLTVIIASAPHGTDVLKDLKIVGTLSK